MKFETFIVDAIQNAAKHKTTIHFIAKNKVEGCAGYYSPPELYVATKRKDWLRIFVHEYSHMLQQVDEDAGVYPGYDHITLDEYAMWENWLFGNVEVEHDVISKLGEKIADMERNCDRRAVELIKKYQLPIKLKQYIQAANAYHTFYEWISINRTWYKRSPYSIKKINDLFSGDEIVKTKLTPEYDQLIRKLCV